MSSSPDRLVWGNYETTEPLKFTDYITIHKGHNMLAEAYYTTDNIGYINSYILFFKKDKITGRVYKTHVRITKELLKSVHGIIYYQKFPILEVQALNGKNIMMNFYINLILELKERLRKNHFLVKVFQQGFLISALTSKLLKDLEMVL